MDSPITPVSLKDVVPVPDQHGGTAGAPGRMRLLVGIGHPGAAAALAGSSL